jgi:hypothetical protein
MDTSTFALACGNTLGLLKRHAMGEMRPARDEAYPVSPEHLAWMLLQAAMFYQDGRVEKANRWLGYAQGVMAALAYATLSELKRANMPPDAEFDGERI